MTELYRSLPRRAWLCVYRMARAITLISVARPAVSTNETMETRATGGTPCPLLGSSGGATYLTRAPFGELYRLADRHLYTAKNTGRDRVAIMQAA